MPSVVIETEERMYTERESEWMCECVWEREKVRKENHICLLLLRIAYEGEKGKMKKKKLWINKQDLDCAGTFHIALNREKNKWVNEVENE